MAAGRVWSTRFIGAAVQTAAQATAAGYVVPAGRIAVVRSIDFYVDGIGNMFVGPVVGTFFSIVVSTAGVPELQARHWDGDQVLYAGERLNVAWASGAFRLTVSGFLLAAT